MLASDVFYDLPSREALAQRMAEMLKRDGTLLVALPLESIYRPEDQASPNAVRRLALALPRSLPRSHSASLSLCLALCLALPRSLPCTASLYTSPCLAL